jgi:hypothetical protein
MAMRSRKLSLCLAGVGLIPLAGCASVDPGFGEAMRYDMAVQTVDPDPQYPEGSLQPGYHGERGQKAIDRYRKGTVKAPAAQSSSSSGGGSGN